MAVCIYRCKVCKSAKRVGYRTIKSHAGYGRFEYSYRRLDNGALGPGGESCCGRPMSFGWLKAFLNPVVKCNSRCTHAVGFQCECSCGGENHARGNAIGAGLFTGLVAA